jgi:prepilin-type N-terminal cleavage/methylation domain-containing protein
MGNARPRNVAGYTVIELLFVMVVLGILLAITYIKVGPALERARVRGAAGVLATDLQYAQALAARYRTPMVFTVDAAQKTYQIADRGGANVYRRRNFGTGGEYVLDQFAAIPTAVEVLPNAVVAQSATYTLGLNGYRRQVTFSRAGQIRVATLP